MLEQYLVISTPQRLLAYRRYREQRGDYWTVEHFERWHWEYLYSLVSLDKQLGRINHILVHAARGKAYTDLVAARVSVCAHLELAEELVPLEALSGFFGKHEKYA